MSNQSIFMRFPGGLAKALTLSYDDAVVQDSRLIDIMKAYGLKGTFNISTDQYIPKGFEYPPEKTWGQRMTKEEATALYSQEGIEPALHAHTHAYLQTLPAPQIAYEIIKNREVLEEQFDRIVRGMAYPYGTYSDEVVRVLRECGILYARTTRATRDFSMPTEWLTLHPTCHHNDPTLPELTKKFLETTIHSDQHPWMFYLWGHAYEFARDDNWHVIEDFAKQISGKEDIWYATNMEIWEYTNNFKKLVFSLDERYVYNPTAQTMYFKLYRNLYTVAPGETIRTNS